VASSYKYGIELSGYIKDGKFLSTIWGSHSSEHEDGCLLGCSAA
jgi:hypothetical protein